MMKKWKKLMAAVCTTSMLVTMPWTGVLADEMQETYAESVVAEETVASELEVIEGSPESATNYNLSEENVTDVLAEDSELVSMEDTESVASGTCGKNLTWTLTCDENDGYTLTISGSGAMANYGFGMKECAPWYSNYKDQISKIILSPNVSSIGSYAFHCCRNLTSITIPDSVTYIGIKAFYECSSLTSITIPDSVTSIGEAAFFDCSSLISIDIPDSVTFLGDYAFANCSGLTSITISGRLTFIGDGTFVGCNLTSFSIPNSVTSIGEAAFSGCSSLTSIFVPNSVTSIGNSAFSVCCSLTSITIPDSVTTIGDAAFSDCKSLTSITIPNSVTSIGDAAFYGCMDLTSITIPDNVTSIGEYAFYYCKSLTHISIPSSVTSIGKSAFDSCFSLSSITIPASVTYIGSSAFRYCDMLRSIYFAGKAPTIGNDTFLEVTATAYYPEGNSTWTEDRRQSYGGTITWVYWDGHYLPDDGDYSNDNIITYETSFSFPEDAFATVQAKIGDTYNGYYIKSNHYAKLTKEMSPSEKEQIVYVPGLFSKKSKYNIDGQSKNYVEWGGSCYGVAVASLLNSSGILTASDFNTNADRLRSVTFDNQATSVCNYYFCQQASSQIQSLSKKFQKKPVVDRLGFIENCIKEGNPVIICFSWVEYKKNSLIYSFIMGKEIIESSTYGHTVLGYGAELNGAWKRSVNGIEKIYNNRIKIYDCNVEAEDDRYWIYYNENGDWCIPIYKAIGNAAEESSFDSGFTAVIQLAASSNEELNIIDYHTGNYNKEVTSNNDVISLNANVRYKLTWGDGTECIIKGLDYEWVGEGKKDISLFIQTNGDGTDICEVVLPSDNCDYEITSDDNIEFAILQEGKFVSIIADNLGAARVADTESISLKFDKESSYSISTTDDEENALSTVVVSGIKTNEVEIRRGDSDVEIISDNTKEMKVKIETKEEKEDCIEILNNYYGLKVLQEAGEISAYGDSEGAGIYDNKAEYRYFDENATIASVEILIEEGTFIYTGTRITPVVTVKDSSNNTLIENRDFTITYSDNINAGTATVTVNGKGNYTGTISKSFTIAKSAPTLKFASTSLSKKTGDAAFTNSLTKTTDGIVTFKSSNTNVAIVNNTSGLVTIKGAGTATITATASEGKNYKAGSTAYSLKVEEPKPTVTGFSDVQDPSHPYYKAIYWAAERGITKGYSDGTFGINRSCTRGEMMMFLWRYAGKPASKNVSKSPFKDVPKTHTFYKAILWGSQKGITKGYSDGTFGVNRNVSRGECMMFLWRLKGKPSPKAVAKAPFPDVPKSHVFYNAVLWGYQKKITTGFTSGKLKGKFGVNENCSRGQIVTFLYRAK